MSTNQQPNIPMGESTGKINLEGLRGEAGRLRLRVLSLEEELAGTRALEARVRGQIDGVEAARAEVEGELSRIREELAAARKAAVGQEVRKKLKAETLKAETAAARKS